MKTTQTQVFLVLSVLISASSALAGEGPQKISFLVEGKQIQALELSKLIQSYPHNQLKVSDPVADQEMTYKGLQTRTVFQNIFGEAWKNAELVLFICADGYRSPVPRAAFDNAKSILAFQAVGAEFKINNPKENKKEIQLAPLYLVWDNQNSAAVKSEGGTYWPYQIVGVELTHFSTKYPHMIPAHSASAEVQAGFKLFQKHCVSCHKVNGDGGEIGPELGKVADGKKANREFLARWISDPSEVKPGTQMQAFFKNSPKHDQNISQLISYLEAMAKMPHKKK